MVRDSNDDMTEASIAATKIQANFRGYRVRKRLKELEKDATKPTSAMSVTSAMAARQCDRQRKELLAEEEEEERDATKGSLEEKSATKIQAQVRGFLARKKQQMAQVAATKIQAGFRGFRTRKLLQRNEQ